VFPVFVHLYLSWTCILHVVITMTPTFPPVSLYSPYEAQFCSDPTPYTIDPSVADYTSLPPLLRARHLGIQEVQIVPPPRNLNPCYVSWKGASVMCNIEGLSDMWFEKEEWEALGPRTLKDRCLFF
jgi:actin-related protein